MKLSILIPSAPDRHKETANLLWVIQKQCNIVPKVVNIIRDRYKLSVMDFEWNNIPVRVLVAIDNKELPIGEKRELLYREAEFEYSWQLDSDDTIAPNSIELILQAIEEKPDCITFQEHCTINGEFFSSNHSLKYEDWGEKQDGFDYVRTPFMKSVIKTEIARSVPVPHIRYGEDHEWARALKPHLKTEIHIPEYIYFYQHNSKPEDHAKRYGIKG